MNRAPVYIVLGLLSICFSYLAMPDNVFEEHFSVMLLIVFLGKFIADLNYKLSVKNIIAIIAILQWLYGASLGYKYSEIVYTDYIMRVDKSVYFGYVFPATVSMLLGLYILPEGMKTQTILNKLDFTGTYQKGVFLILFGFIMGFIPFLGFLAVLLSNLKYIGLFYVYFSKHRYRNRWVIVVLGSLFLNSLGQGMFHDLLLWGTFFITVYFISNRSSLLRRSIILTVGFLSILVIQVSKSDIRRVVWANELSSTQRYLVGVGTLFSKITGNESFFSEENIANNVVRLNQGWIISNVMYNIPSNTPYANGLTVKESVIAAIFPRFIFPEKALAGGRGNMEKYAGITIGEYTSMDISQVGEAYANFGVTGGIIFMFFLGLFFAIIIKLIEKQSLKYPELILWLPLLFLQVVKAETSLLTILNHLVKALIVVWFFYSSIGKSFISQGVKLLPEFIKK